MVSLFAQDSDHYTVLLNNQDLRHVPARTVSRDSPLPSWEYVPPLSPFHPVDHTSSMPCKPKSALDAASIQTILEENDCVSKFSPEASYSPFLIRKIVSTFSYSAPRIIQDSLRFVENPRRWNLNSFAEISKTFPQSTDLGFSLLSNPDFNMIAALKETIHPDVKLIQQKIISRSNRCFVIHIAACLGIHPLILEAQLVEGATRLLLCNDCHYSKHDILKSILSQDDHVNADILKLVFPPCLDGAIIRIVKIRDRVPPIKAIAYRQNQDSIITREVNLMLFNGHFTYVNFLRMIQFDLYTKAANVMIGSPIIDNYVAHKFGSPVQAPQTSVTQSQVTSSISHSPENTSPRSDRVCSCGGTRYEQTLNCIVCLQCDLHSVLPPPCPIRRYPPVQI